MAGLSRAYQPLHTAGVPEVHRPARPRYSFALAMYCDESTVDEFHRRLTSTLEEMGCTYELVFVNDGSTDRTFEKLEQLFERDPHVTCIIDLMRNVGQGNALTAAFAHCRGERVVVLDSDLQLAPEDFPRLAEKYDQGYDLVSAYREHRADPWFRRAGSLVFNGLIRRISRMQYRDFGCAYKIFDGDLIRAFEYGPFRPFCASSLLSAPQRVAEVPIRQLPRAQGRSGWTLPRLIAAFVDRSVAISPIALYAVGALFLLNLALLIAGDVLLLTVGGLDNLEMTLLMFNLLAAMTTGATGALVVVVYFVWHNFVAAKDAPAYIIRHKREREALVSDTAKVYVESK
ncbi:MAG: glycosyltransferase [Candidatus Hydrogenedens sp.]|nr:glycosyltransferase [Candidatus Hydrogenedens sp.]